MYFCLCLEYNPPNCSTFFNQTVEGMFGLLVLQFEQEKEDLQWWIDSLPHILCPVHSGLPSIVITLVHVFCPVHSGLPSVVITSVHIFCPVHSGLPSIVITSVRVFCPVHNGLPSIVITSHFLSCT